jgi:hypothetical protein
VSGRQSIGLFIVMSVFPFKVRSGELDHVYAAKIGISAPPAQAEEHMLHLIANGATIACA